jgi:hypothetical protein
VCPQGTGSSVPPSWCLLIVCPVRAGCLTRGS